MRRDTDDETDDATDSLPTVSRRRVLSVAGAGTGLAAVASAGLGGEYAVGSSPAQEETPTATETPTETAEEGDEALIDDLVDPTFGYPLAADETETVSLQHVVDVTIEEGEGAHPDFPAEPDQDAPGSFVEIPAEFFFDPVGLHVEPGDLVHFNTVTGLHTVTAFHEFSDPNLEVPTRVPHAVPPFTSPPLTPGRSWVYQFTETGVYDYLCLPHLGLGMVARIVVFDPEEDDIESETFAAPTTGPLFPNDARVLQADELAPENIVDEGTVPWADLTIAAPTPTETGTGTEGE